MVGFRLGLPVKPVRVRPPHPEGKEVFLTSSAPTAITASAWEDVIDALTAQISVTTVVGVLATVVAACVGLVFMWWGVRKAIRALMSAFRKGRLSA